MQLDKAGEASTIGDLIAGFAGRSWLPEITDLHEQEKLAADAAGAVRFYPGGLETDEPVETGDGPYVVVVDGDLVTPGHVDLDSDDYRQARVIVTGGLRAGSLSFGNGTRVVVGGAARIASVCVGQYGDRNAMLAVGGELSVPLLALDMHTSAWAGAGIRAVIYAGQGWWHSLEPDIPAGEGDDDRFFPDELLDYTGCLDLDKAIATGRAGAPLLLPGVAETFPGHSRPRLTG